MKLSFCTMMVHERERKLLPLHLYSLKYYMPDYLEGFRICVPDDNNEIIEQCKKHKIEVVPHPTYVQFDVSGGLKQIGYDTASRMDKLMQTCVSDWVVISHLDIIYTGSILEALLPYMNDSYGVIGIWAHGCTAVNKKAFDCCHFTFWPFTCFQVQVLSENHVRVRGSNTPKEGDGKIYGALGIDTGEFITIEAPVYGFKFEVSNLINHYHHVGGQSYEQTRETEEDRKLVQEIEDRKEKALKMFGEFNQ